MHRGLENVIFVHIEGTSSCSFGHLILKKIKLNQQSELCWMWTRFRALLFHFPTVETDSEAVFLMFAFIRIRERERGRKKWRKNRARKSKCLNIVPAPYFQRKRSLFTLLLLSFKQFSDGVVKGEGRKWVKVGLPNGFLCFSW